MYFMQSLVASTLEKTMSFKINVIQYGFPYTSSIWSHGIFVNKVINIDYTWPDVK